MWHAGQGAVARVLPLVIRNCANTAEHMVCLTDLSRAGQCSVTLFAGPVFSRTCLDSCMAHIFSYYKLLWSFSWFFFFFLLNWSWYEPWIPDIYSDKKSFPHFKDFEPTSRINVLIYFERRKGPVGINTIETWNGDLSLIWMISKQYKKRLWYPQRQLPNFDVQYSMFFLHLERMAFSSTKIKTIYYNLNTGS